MISGPPTHTNALIQLGCDIVELVAEYTAYLIEGTVVSGNVSDITISARAQFFVTIATLT